MTTDNETYRFILANSRELSTVDCLVYIEQDIRSIRRRVETGQADPGVEDASARIAAYATILNGRGF
jgi:hypothetical protein